MKLIILLLLAFTSSNAFSLDLREETINSILSSLKCEGDVESILGSFRDLEEKRDSLAKVGIIFSISGEDMDEKITLNFSEPFTLYGAKSSMAELYLSGDFIVSADFSGDPEPLIKKMNLTQSDSEIEGDFVAPPPPENECPPTKRLRKSGVNKFSFGCGWCNG